MTVTESCKKPLGVFEYKAMVPRIAIVGLGNLILSDDAVGIHVARTIKKMLDENPITSAECHVIEASVGGIELVEMILGFDAAFIIDSIQTIDGKIGDIYRLKPEDLSNSKGISNLHNVGFTTALELWGKIYKDGIPEYIILYAVEVGEVHTFSENMDPEVAVKVPEIATMVIKDIKNIVRFLS